MKSSYQIYISEENWMGNLRHKVKLFDSTYDSSSKANQLGADVLQLVRYKRYV